MKDVELKFRKHAEVERYLGMNELSSTKATRHTRRLSSEKKTKRRKREKHRFSELWKRGN